MFFGMRKQYHFRPSDRGLLAWDVDRLVDLSKGLPVVDVAVESIRELDEIYWFDGKKEQPTCRRIVDHLRLIEEASFDYPIILCADGGVMDGMHRVAKALLEGRDEIAAVRFPKTPEPDYVGREPDELPY